jgi:hypothetical protein
MNIDTAIENIDNFQGTSLTESLAIIEAAIVGLDINGLQELCHGYRINNSFMASALTIKKLAGQINVIIHAAGILCSLPAILRPDEVVQSVSLGAGNTGRQFDLETNLRIAEYKFIDWQGGAESIRQNGIFKDFFSLAEYDTKKSKHLYVVGTNHPLKFFSGGRSLTSVLSRHPKILSYISGKYGKNINKVRDYYELKKSEVEIQDISAYIGRNT